MTFDARKYGGGRKQKLDGKTCHIIIKGELAKSFNVFCKENAYNKNKLVSKIITKYMELEK